MKFKQRRLGLGILGICSILQSYFKLSKMSSKKKSMPLTSKNQQSNSKLTTDNRHGVRKSFQKHSRKGTKDYEPINLQSLVNARLYASARQLSNLNHIESINSIVFGYSSIYSLQLKEAIALSNTTEHLNSYYILNKHKNEYLTGKITIEASLVQTIQGKTHLQFISKPIMHFEANIYHIMDRHMARRKKYLKKISLFQNQSSVHREPTPWTKELPTLVSDRDRDNESELFDRKKYGNSQQLNTSESFELKKLTECIKEMFNKQIFDHPKEKMMVWTGGKSSWLIEGKSVQKKRLLECDYSSIQSASKYELQMDSKMNDKWSSEVQENYGLGSLRRRYEQQRLSKLKQSSEINDKNSKPLGHKRNPTESLHTRQYLMEEPMTPKESCRSVFTSTQNIILNSPKYRKSKSKNKEFDVNEAYLLRFEKQKQPGTHTNTKQNFKKQKSKVKSEFSKSRSKQKLKFAAKKK